jgi:hypothetical protein
MLTIHGQRHPREDVNRLYVSRKEEGGGVMVLEGAYVREIMTLMEYIENKGYSLIQVAGTHQHHTKSTPLQTVENLKKSFQSEQSKKNIIIHNIKA